MDLSPSSPNSEAQNATMPLRDFGSFVNTSGVSDAEIKDHRSAESVYVGLHLPRPQHRRRRRGHKHHKKAAQQSSQDLAMTDATPPSQHVQFLLGEEEDDEEHKTHDLFCELGELFSTPDGDLHWKETARWIKFEEDVEEGGERWSKPHVATLSLHSLFELRSCIHNGCVILDMDAQFFFQIIDLTLDQLVATNQLEETLKDQVRDVLMQRHRHLNEKHEKKHDNNSSKIHLPIIRSLADIGRKYSLPKDMSHQNADIEEPAHHGNFLETAFNHDRALDIVYEEDAPSRSSSRRFRNESKKKLTGVKTMPNINMPKVDSNPKMESTGSDSKLKRNQSSGNDLHETASSVKLNMHFMKKIPPGSEAANVLVGEVDFLNHQIVTFIRLRQSLILGDLTEVPVPTKFLFILLGPQGHQNKYHEIGRSIATLMTDEIFHDVAYHAHNREDLLAGIDEFLDQVTVLPPGEWDPSIRIEPPKSVPSQESRKNKDSQPPIPNGKMTTDEEEEGSHGDDPALQRTHRLFGGLIQDIKRKAPFYLSDFKDALHVQTLASFMFLYFACLTPIITFGGLLADATDKDLGAFESLLAGCIVGVVYAVCSGQPLTILGSTGPVLVFETILYSFCKDMDWHYLSFRWWVGLWTGAALIAMVAFDLSALVRYITRFTEESFAALISVIFIKEAIAKCIAITHKAPVNFDPDISPFYDCICIRNETDGNGTHYKVISNKTIDWYTIHPHECEDMGGVLTGTGCDHVADVFFLSLLLFLLTFTVAYALKAIRNGRFFPAKVRAVISDFAVVIAIGVAVGTDAIIGLNTPKLEVPDKFHPTNHLNRGWLIPPFHEKNPKWLCIAAIIPALLATILFFMDQQITAVIVNRRENKLKKGCGYHLDLLIVAVLIIVNSILGLPYFVAATVLSINHVVSLKKESTCTAPGERPKFLGVREQRVTGIAIFLMIGLSVFLTSLLKFIPMPVLYGVFLYMGISSLKGMQLVSRIMILFMPMKYQPDYTFLRHVRVRRVHFFTFIQVLCLVMLWVIKTIKEISIAFPIMVLAMCFIRKGLDSLFTQTELKWLDDIMPDMDRREKDDKERETKEQTVEECETLLDPKCGGSNPANQPKPSIINLAINGGTDSFVNQVNISEEMAKCSIWKNMQSNESKHNMASEQDHRDSSKRNLAKGVPVVLKVKRKHKKRHKKDSNGHHHHSGHNRHLPTIPSSPTERSSKKGGSVAFYIDEEDSEKDDQSDKELITGPEIVVDPPSDSSRS